MKTSSYRPGYFSSLLQSCHSSEFYSRIKDISMLRATAFLGFFSIVVAIFALITLSVFWTRIFPSRDLFLAEYDRSVPAFEAVFDDATLEVTPENVSLFLGFDNEAQLVIDAEPSIRSFVRFHVDTSREITEVAADPPQALGVYLYRDGLFVAGGFQNTSFPYSDFDVQQTFNFTKESFRLFIQGAYPIVQEVLQRLLFVTWPMILFVVHFIGGWVLALVFSLLGILILLILQKPVDFPFLIKLAFYALVPAFVIALITALLSISVSFIPLVVFAAYYFFGLVVYQRS